MTNEPRLAKLDEWSRFQASGEKCFFCFLGWQKYERVHLHPDNLGHVECDALTALQEVSK